MTQAGSEGPSVRGAARRRLQHRRVRDAVPGRDHGDEGDGSARRCSTSVGRSAGPRWRTAGLSVVHPAGESRIRPVLRALSNPVLLTCLGLLVLMVLGVRLPAEVIGFAGVAWAANSFLAMLVIGVGLDLRVTSSHRQAGGGTLGRSLGRVGGGRARDLALGDPAQATGVTVRPELGHVCAAG